MHVNDFKIGFSCVFNFDDNLNSFSHLKSTNFVESMFPTNSVVLLKEHQFIVYSFELHPPFSPPSA